MEFGNVKMVWGNVKVLSQSPGHCSLKILPFGPARDLATGSQQLLMLPHIPSRQCRTFFSSENIQTSSLLLQHLTIFLFVLLACAFKKIMKYWGKDHLKNHYTFALSVSMYLVIAYLFLYECIAFSNMDYSILTNH